MGIFHTGLTKTRQSFFGRLSQMLGGSSEIDEDTWDDIEAILIQADLGVETTKRVMADVHARVESKGLKRTEQVQKALKESLRELMKDPPPANISGRRLSVILIVGVNGSGKTTTIGKLAHRLNNINNRRVIVAAGDTFRAAAIEQLQKWGERVNVPVVASKQGGDPAGVVFDACAAASARNRDVLIVDTAGRLHNNYNLMEELAKIHTVIQKNVTDGPHEVWLVLDGTTGQNALEQAKKFKEKANVTGVIVTKLDSTAKGGMVLAVFQDLGLPVHYIGLGEGMEDLVPFRRDNFIDSLFDEN